MNIGKIVELPDCLPGGKKGEFRDCWNASLGPRPERFDFLDQGKTSLICKECGEIFYCTERHTTDYHYDEVICKGCKRIALVYMGTKSGTLV